MEIHAMVGAAIGIEKDRVAAPHRESVGALVIADLLVVIGFQIVDGNSLGNAAGVTLPGAEIAEDTVEGDLIAVGGKGGEAAFIHGQAFGQSAVHVNGEKAAEPIVKRIATGEI